MSRDSLRWTLTRRTALRLFAISAILMFVRSTPPDSLVMTTLMPSFSRSPLSFAAMSIVKRYSGFPVATPSDPLSGGLLLVIPGSTHSPWLANLVPRVYAYGLSREGVCSSVPGIRLTRLPAHQVPAFRPGPLADGKGYLATLDDDLTPGRVLRQHHAVRVLSGVRPTLDLRLQT